EKRVGLMLQNQDAYIKVTGGVKLDEPAIDLAIAVSIASSFRDQPTNPADIFIGEVGLTGEIRRVSRIEQRVQEAAKLGFKRIICPQKNLDGWQAPKDVTVIGVNTVKEALEEGLASKSKMALRKSFDCMRWLCYVLSDYVKLCDISFKRLKK